MIELTIVGSGTCVPSAERGSPCVHLSIGGESILVDCGPGSLRQLVQADVDYKKIDKVCITHFHPDHIADLIPLIQALNWTPTFTRKKPLTLLGPTGLKQFYAEHMEKLNGKPREGTFMVELIELEETHQEETFSIARHSTRHTENSQAYCFEENGKKAIITGDTGYDENLVPFLRGADILVTECSWTASTKTETHLNPIEAATLAQKAEVKKLVLSHIYPIGTSSSRLEEAKKIFRQTVIAKDFMNLIV